MNEDDKSVLDMLERQFDSAYLDPEIPYLFKLVSTSRSGVLENPVAARELLKPQSKWGPLFGLTQRDIDWAVESLSGKPTLTFWQRLLKRTLDIVVGVLSLIPVALFVVPFVAIAIKLEDGGPVFYRQYRIGRSGRQFGMLKFRTMRTDADARLAEVTSERVGDEPLFVVKTDPRITRVGAIVRRYAIDELPQFWNVLVGDMSIVGPRPMLIGEARSEAQVFDIRPGITGLWQTYYQTNSGLDAAERGYIETWSVAKDLQIMVATAMVMVSPYPGPSQPSS